jgi:hypothetical protein
VIGVTFESFTASLAAFLTVIDETVIVGCSTQYVDAILLLEN